jgi:hypothetical protein
MVSLVSSTAPSNLTLQESARLRQLERIVEAGLEGFLKVGAALAEIRDNRLYRSTHERWSDYCLDRWGLTLSRCNQLISSTRTYDNLVAALPQDADVLAEANEHMLRPLNQLEPDLQRTVWELIRRLEDRPAGRTIEMVVTRIQEAISDGWEEEQTKAEPPGSDISLLPPLPAVTTVITEADNLETGSEENTVTIAGGGNTCTQQPRTRQSDQLGTFSRWVNKVTSWDPTAIALSDDEVRARNHLKAARALRTFCDSFIHALEIRLGDAA